MIEWKWEICIKNSLHSCLYHISLFPDLDWSLRENTDHFPASNAGFAKEIAGKKSGKVKIKFIHRRKKSIFLIITLVLAINRGKWFTDRNIISWSSWYAVWSIINVNKVIFVCLSFNKRSKTVNHDCFQGVPRGSL